MKFNIKSRKGFTLIELLVVIGILAVLAAIAIPSVAGLIDRANVSADNMNANEMTNAIERFTSEYELYCQDVASGTLDVTNLDSAQGRVYNVTGITTRAEVEKFESNGLNGKGVYINTNYPANEATMISVIKNYMKTSSSTFEPKQSDMAYYYSPEIGMVVVAEEGSTEAEINSIAMVEVVTVSLTQVTEDIQWINITKYEVENEKLCVATDTEGVYQKTKSPITKEYEITVPSKLTFEYNGKTYASNSKLIVNGNDKIKVRGEGWSTTVQLEDGLFSFKVSVSSETVSCKAECGMSWQEWLDSDLCTLNDTQRTYLMSRINGKNLGTSGGSFYFNSYGTSEVWDTNDKIEIYGNYNVGIQFPMIPF